MNLRQALRSFVAELFSRNGTEEECAAAVVDLRWPDGFDSPLCAAAEHSWSIWMLGDVWHQSDIAKSEYVSDVRER